MAGEVVRGGGWGVGDGGFMWCYYFCNKYCCCIHGLRKGDAVEMVFDEALLIWTICYSIAMSLP